MSPETYQPPAARYLGGMFYGWYIAIACAALMFVGVGVGYYGLAVFLGPLRDEHGWSSTAVSGATGLYFTISGITGALIGPRIDRSGPIKFMVIGLVVDGLAAASIGFVEELWQLYLAYAVLAIAFGMSSAVATNAIMTRWFIRRRARAMSISSTGVSAGGVILSPLISWLIDVGGLELAAPLMGALVIAVGLPVVLLVVAWDPSLMGLRPDGWTGAEPPEQSARIQATQMRPWTQRELVRTLSFWALLTAFLLVLMAQTGFVIHQVSFLEERFGSRNQAAFALSVTAGGSIVARLIVGLFADAVDKRLLTVVLFLIQGTAVLLILHIENVAATWMLTLVFGLTIGNVYMMQSLLVGEIFGMVSFGAVFGLISLAGQAGSGAGPFGVGLLEDQTGSYMVPFTVSAILTYAAAVFVLFARKVPEAAGAPGEVRDFASGVVPGGE